MKKSRTMFFPGWAMPPDKSLYEGFLPAQIFPVEIADYGFFNPEKRFDFRNPESELAKFAKNQYDFLIGYSLGSQFALRLSMALEQAPKALIIICGFAKFAESKNNPDGQKLFALNSMISAMKIRPSKVLREFYQLSFGSLKKIVVDEKNIPVPSAMIEALRFLLNCDFRSETAKIDCPCLVIAGEDDTVVKASLSAKLAESMPNAEFICEKGVGHSLPFSKREKIRHSIYEFFSKKDIV